MKKRITIITIIALIFAMANIQAALATEDHGADAHSASMSIGSGEEPIPDESVTLDEGASNAESGDDETVDESQPEETTVDESGQTIPIWAVVVIAALVVALVVTLIVRSKRRTKKIKYKSRH